ncbi:selenide, water dikinase SelD [Litoribacillus peritrichatus]|uniref:Selenide, water dikinase SelD n=1 Tax=Litoribacillus peritrichatus TaxID=718191 RepID=A0ABP7M4R0_9GAMM
MQDTPIVKEVVLVGGGHSHALVINQWAMNPIPGVRLTLISPQVMTPYSGMLPGLVAGHYSFDETHIDLVKLCRYAKVRFIQGRVEGLQPEQNQVLLMDRPSLNYDIISFDTGSTPDLSVKGAEAFSTPVKPIDQFHRRWETLITSLIEKQTDHAPLTLSVVGNGAGGIELILAMSYKLRQLNLPSNLKFQLIARGSQLISGYPKRLQKKLSQILQHNQVEFISNFDVVELKHNEIISKTGQSCPSDITFWCTQAKGANWLKNTGLKLSEQGFIRIKPTLQSLDFDNVFAAGDVAHFDHKPLPKAGVYAVRMADSLFHNISSLLLEKPLKSYRPQGDFLSLLACGDKTALGTKSGITISGEWVWHWKDRIDRKFMTMLQQLPDNMPSDPSSKALPDVLAQLLSQETQKDISDLAMRCGGCGAKVGADVLHQALESITTVQRKEVILGLDAPDDAAIIEVPEIKHLVQTIDQFRSFIDDPYLFGQIATQHALSDCFAMGADPVSALASVIVPYGSEQHTISEIKQLMAGATQALNEANCQLVGGHTAEGSQLSLGFNINGLISKHSALTKTGVKPNQVIIATKALGTGVIFAADMRHQAKGVWVEAALNTMLQSNQKAAQILYQLNASACTDITGFGVLGHLVEMLRGSGLGAELTLSHLPVLEGALELFEKGYSSSLQPQNVRLRRAISNQQEVQQHKQYPLIFDPQTSGGLLVAIDADGAEQALSALHQAGYSQSRIIGKITPLPEQGVVTVK